MLQGRVYATAIPSVCPSVSLSVCHTAEHIIEILSVSDRPIILVFHHHGSLCKTLPTGVLNRRVVAIFDQYAAISNNR